jgi:hypothetical protein
MTYILYSFRVCYANPQVLEKQLKQIEQSVRPCLQLVAILDANVVLHTSHTVSERSCGGP